MASWKSGYPESILLTGRSGVGKSALRNFCELQIINERNIFICTGQSLEHQQKAPLYIFGEILRELAHHIKHRINLKEVTPSTSKRGSKYSQSISGNSAMRSNRSSMLKPHGEGQDRRKSTALSILESAQSLSSHRGSFTFSGLFGPTTESPPAVPTPPSVASPSIPTSIRQSSNTRHLSMDNQNQNRRRSLVQDITNILMGRRSTVDNSRVSGVLPEAPPALPTRSKTESATKQSGDSFMKKSSSQLKSVDTSYSQSNSKLLIRNPNYLAPNTSGSILAKSNESYPLKSSKSSVIDHSMLGLYLQSMGEPQSSIELLKFIPGVLDASDNNTQMAADIIPRISGVVSNILDSLASFGIKIAFIFDDLQWCDSHSYDLLTSLMRKCPSIMFILSCRPAEEWSKMYLDRFFALSGLSKHKIPIAPFRYEAIDELIRYKFRNIMAHTDTVSNALVKDVLERSQGIALVTNIFVNMLLEESLLKVENGVLTYANEHSAIELPNEAMGAIVSQFDKLSVPMKIVLRLAAMCGQYFDTQELSQVIESSNLKQTLTTIDCDPIKLYNHIINSDKYRFIKRGDSPNTLAFTHYLIQQGILSTVIPSKREEMHEMLANYYESKLNDDKASDRKYYYTEVLIFHLMQIAGQYERKQTVILKAFVESATMFRSSEALEYYDLLLSIRKDGQGLTQLTQLQESKENRLLGQIYYELGDRQTAINHYYQSLANLGHIVPKSFFRKLLSTFHFTQTIKKFINSPTDQQQTISLQLLCTEFPVLAAALQRQNTSQTLTETLFSEVSTSISGIIRILAVNKTSLEYALFNTFAICLMGCDQTDWKLRYCLTYLLTSQTKLPLRFLHETLNESLAALSDILYTQVLDEYKVEQMTSPQTVMYSELVRCKAVLSRARGDWRVALDGFQDFEEIKVVIGLGTSEDAFWSRSKVVEMLTL
ncbi:hypothetical protein BCR33DRAFT_550507 [Rhizoclosmatium globosum]|uniref:Orc1-like AAA ATPase domain-containing protein n=1 Tax=Rhizoclosmatium globosum TaxID=329046 RepID=A0A1Y2BAR6_9FUNG|nr:hypothetical protein BCR33DRAFT_550507 [Rhizoclosmatium globosum]|eukprot:ORY31165.1 hypothetical protein BCR33DRAFT_550507 [Rhizoclosmatium globosum]